MITSSASIQLTSPFPKKSRLGRSLKLLLNFSKKPAPIDVYLEYIWGLFFLGSFEKCCCKIPFLDQFRLNLVSCELVRIFSKESFIVWTFSFVNGTVRPNFLNLSIKTIIYQYLLFFFKPNASIDQMLSIGFVCGVIFLIGLESVCSIKTLFFWVIYLFTKKIEPHLYITLHVIKLGIESFYSDALNLLSKSLKSAYQNRRFCNISYFLSWYQFKTVLILHALHSEGFLWEVSTRFSVLQITHVLKTSSPV